MSCHIQHMNFHVPARWVDESYPPTPASVIDYSDGHWCLRFGEYGFTSDVIGLTEDMYALHKLLGDMLEANEQEQAAISGDYETEPKWEEKNTEAWLDTGMDKEIEEEL